MKAYQKGVILFLQIMMPFLIGIVTAICGLNLWNGDAYALVMIIFCNVLYYVGIQVGRTIGRNE